LSTKRIAAPFLECFLVTAELGIPCPVSRMRTRKGWKLLLDGFLCANTGTSTTEARRHGGTEKIGISQKLTTDDSWVISLSHLA
jgi:hypothetical protein